MGYGDMMTGAIKRKTAKAPAGVDFGDSASMQTEAQNQYGTEAGYGSDASSAYLERAKSFDPQAAVSQYAQGAWGSISDALKKQLSDTRGGAVGAGRYDSGYLDEDQGTVINQATKQLSDSIAQQSVAASGQSLANTTAMGNFGQGATQDANELLSGQREFQYNKEREDAERARKKRSGIGSAIGGVIGGAGAFLATGGNPLAAYAGYKGGSAIGGAF